MDQGRHVNHLDRGGDPHRPIPGTLAGGHQDQQRPHPLPTRGQGGLGLFSEPRAVARGDLGEPALDLRHAHGQPSARGVHHGGHWGRY
jgi:hypothetical protein